LGGFGANPAAEAHGGFTFCAVASLAMLGEQVPRKDRLHVWCKARLFPRFNGRPGKPSDCCYVWWICGSLWNLGSPDIISESQIEGIEEILVRNFVVPETGGFSKYPSVPIDGDESSIHGKQSADLFHTFLVICSLALMRPGGGVIDSECVVPLHCSAK
jgi:geranylgeranyl transferase type-1 subunit beta